MSIVINKKSSLDDIIKITKFIKIDKDNVEEITEKNSKEIFKKRNIYIEYDGNVQIGIGHIVYTKTNITASQNNEINEALKKTFINYVYLKNSNNNIHPKLINIEENIDGDIDDNLYFEFKKEYNKQKNEIELSFTFKTSKSVTLKIYDYFFENNNTNYYITSGKCRSDNNKDKYYENATDGNLFNAFQQIFDPDDIETINFILQNKFEELKDIVKNVYIDSKSNPYIKKYYDIASEFTIENKKVNIDGFIDFINKNNNWWTIEDLKILSKYFNLNCNVIEFNDNDIPIKNIPLNHSEGCKLYPFTDENQLYPYTFCNLDGNKWYLKKHNCQIKYDDFKGGAKQRYEDLKNQELKNQEINRIDDDDDNNNNNDDEDDVVCDIDEYDDDDDDDDDKDNDNNDNSSPPNTDQKKMNIQKRTTVDYFFAKNSSFIESKGKKYLFAIVYTDTDKKKDNIEDVDFNSIIDLKENLVFKKEQKEQKEQRYVNSFRADIRITNINNPVYEIDYNTQKYYVIPL